MVTIDTLVSHSMTGFHNAKPRGHYALGSLERALSILETLAEEPNLSATEVGERIGASKATVFRHLSVLRERGYLASDDAKRYALGPRLLQLGFVAHDQLSLPRVAIDVMRQLRDEFDETVHLGMLVDDDVVHIETVPSSQPLKMAAAIGERAWPHVSSLGKCLWAWRDIDSLRAELPEILPAQSPKSLTTRAALLEDLIVVRQRGYALDDEESGIGIRCIGAPIRGPGGQVLAAMSISAPADRVTRERVPELSARLILAARDVSRECGWTPRDGDGFSFSPRSSVAP